MSDSKQTQKSPVDPIVSEIHDFRHEHAKKFNYDLDAIYQDILIRQNNRLIGVSKDKGADIKRKIS